MARRKPIRQINLRITEQLRQRLGSAAQERRISTNELMRQLLEDGLEKENKAKQSLEQRVRHLEERLAEGVQRSGPSLAQLEAERQQRDQEEGGEV
jgi:hypothetical protein